MDLIIGDACYRSSNLMMYKTPTVRLPDDAR